MNDLPTKNGRRRSIYEIVTIGFIAISFAIAIASVVSVLVFTHRTQGNAPPLVQTLNSPATQPQTLDEEASHAFLATLDSHVIVRDKSFYMHYYVTHGGFFGQLNLPVNAGSKLRRVSEAIFEVKTKGSPMGDLSISVVDLHQVDELNGISWSGRVDLGGAMRFFPLRLLEGQLDDSDKSWIPWNKYNVHADLKKLNGAWSVGNLEHKFGGNWTGKPIEDTTVEITQADLVLVAH
jgi:hypothetical protein